MVSEWLSPNGGMPQGTWLGVYIFLTLINDLKSTFNLHKFVDDCTLSEILPRFAVSSMQPEIDDLNKWSKDNYMNINHLLRGSAKQNVKDGLGSLWQHGKFNTSQLRNL